MLLLRKTKEGQQIFRTNPVQGQAVRIRQIQHAGRSASRKERSRGRNKRRDIFGKLETEKNKRKTAPKYGRIYNRILILTH
jgi:hypothetical protein